MCINTHTMVVGWKKILKISHALVTTCWLFFIYSDYFQYSSNYFIKPEQNHILFYIKFDNDYSLLLVVLTNLLSEAVRNKRLSRWAFWKYASYCFSGKWGGGGYFIFNILLRAWRFRFKRTSFRFTPNHWVYGERSFTCCSRPEPGTRCHELSCSC